MPLNSIPLPHPRSHRLRLGRWSSEGQIYFLTITTKDRIHLFERFWSARVVIGVLARQRCRTWAYVLMPDHLHWLIQLGDRPSLSDLVRDFKSESARRLNQHLGGSGTVWQRGFHDRAVRAHEDLPTVARYLVRNPIRAGLVAKAGDYSHWDAAWID